MLAITKTVQFRSCKQQKRFASARQPNKSAVSFFLGTNVLFKVENAKTPKLISTNVVLPAARAHNTHTEH